MPFKIVRNDITKMNTEAIVNTANDHPTVDVKEGEAFITPGYNLPAKYIIHAVSPHYIDGEHGEEELLRSCYRNSLTVAKENRIKSIAFPLISTGGFGYQKEEVMRIAVDEINAFLLDNDIDITLVVFDIKATELGENIYPKLQSYIDQNYVGKKHNEEYKDAIAKASRKEGRGFKECIRRCFKSEDKSVKMTFGAVEAAPMMSQAQPMMGEPICKAADFDDKCDEIELSWDAEEAVDELNKKLNERLAHRSDTFSEYLLYLIDSKGMKNVDVYKRAIVDKRYFAKLKNNKDFHPEKIKALCLCVGAQLSLDETKDLLARAGYALSPADMTDIIFSFYIEHNHFDVIDIDIQLEEHGLPCIIS